MRKPLNKALVPTTAAKGEKGMNPEFQKIMDIAAGITIETPEKRQEFVQGIEAAQAARAKAVAAKESAATEEEFNQACDDELRAKLKENYFTKQLDALQHSPRMDEDAYNFAVNTVDSIVLDAAESFRKIASAAMESIVQARKEYIQTLREADKTLSALDKAANVLQSKYRYHVFRYTDGKEVRREDPSEWKLHTTRYMKDKGYVYACRDPKKGRPSVWQSNAWDRYLAAAWRAANRVSE